MLGAELAGDEAGKVADLRRDFTERAGDKAGHEPRVVSFYLCLDGPGCVRGRAEFRVELPGSLVVVFLTRKLIPCASGRMHRIP